MTNFIFKMPRPTKCGIKVISTSLGFTAVERQTVVRKTLKIWVKFGVAAPRPQGKYQNLNPRVNCSGHSSNQNCKRKFSGCYMFPKLVFPVFAITFWQNFVKKFPFPSPSPGAHHVRNLSRPAGGQSPRARRAQTCPLPMSHDRRHHYGRFSDGLYDSKTPKTRNRK